jgi:hemerythrin
MTFMEWEDRFDLGVGAMDDQHRGLIAAMNELHDRATAGASPQEVLHLVDDLLERTVAHFAAEEAHMKSVGFEGLAIHRTIHHSLLERLGGHRQTLVDTGAVDDGFFRFLKYWLASHICGIDTKYAELTVGSR